MTIKDLETEVSIKIAVQKIQEGLAEIATILKSKKGE